MYSKAVENGIAADKYYSMTYGEIIVQAEANAAIKKRELEEQAFLDYKAAQLNAYALNDPKKMPKFNEHYNFNQQTEVDETGSHKPKQQDWQVMKARMMEASMMIKQTRAKKNMMEGGG